MGEEIANSISHGIGAIIGIVFLILMIIKGVRANNSRAIIGYAIFGSSVILTFLFSTLYHSITNMKAKSILRIFDHSSIYLLIAGTYTPIILIVFSSPKRYYFLFATWAIALGGIFFKIFTHGKYEKYAKVSLFLYILMGWISLLLIRPIIRYGTFRFFFWILAGGIIYTLGTIFFEMKKVKYSHFIWHLFVLTASIFHIIGIYKYLI